MSRTGLLNTTCRIARKTSTTDIYGQFQYRYLEIDTPICAFQYLRGSSTSISGQQQTTLTIRVYLQQGVRTKIEDVIELDDRRWEVTWINPLSYQTGATEGMQVDCKFIG